MSTLHNVGVTRISTSDVWCDSIHPSSLHHLIDPFPSVLAAVISFLFSSIHPSIHPSTLSSTWSSLGLLACCEMKTSAGRGQNEHPSAWVHRRWHHRNRYWWSTPAAHLSSTLHSLFIVHIFFFFLMFLCLFGDLFCNFLPSFLWFALLFCCFSVSVSRFPGGCFYHNSN